MWEEESEVARYAATEAGRILRRRFGHVTPVSKKGEIDLVTEADIEAEKKILEILQHHYPKDSVLSEESGRTERSSSRIWFVDPLDGTTNFAHGFPFFAVSIALQVEGNIVAGVVYNPQMDEYFEARDGSGAFLNNAPLQVSGIKTLGDALLGTGFPYTVHDKPEEVVRLLERFVVVAQGIRRPGAASIDLCYVAAGKLDGFWEQGLKPWDTAAGAVIVREAGGLVSAFSGEPYSPYSDTVVAANPFIHGAMVKVLAA